MCRHLVSKQDISAADKEYDAILNCTMMIEIYLKKGNLNEAQECIKAMEKSLNVLKRLIEKNQSDSMITGIITRLKETGVDASTIIKKIKKAE